MAGVAEVAGGPTEIRVSLKDSPDVVWEPNETAAGSSCPLDELSPRAQVKYGELDQLIKGGCVLSSPSAEESLAFRVGQQSINYSEFQILQYSYDNWNGELLPHLKCLEILLQKLEFVKIMTLYPC